MTTPGNIDRRAGAVMAFGEEPSIEECRYIESWGTKILCDCDDAQHLLMAGFAVRAALAMLEAKQLREEVARLEADSELFCGRGFDPRDHDPASCTHCGGTITSPSRP